MLGIIGGMGPMASAVFYDMISSKTDASCDQENLNLILLSHAGMPDRTEAILSKDEAQIEAVRSKLYADAIFLQNAGCTAIAVTCNTAHYFVNMIEDELDIPFIHLIRETAEAVASEFGARKVAVLATDGTIETRLYQDELSKRGVIAFTPKAEVQALVMKLLSLLALSFQLLGRNFRLEAFTLTLWTSWQKAAWISTKRGAKSRREDNI